MTDAFHARIRISLADENLQKALDANTDRRTTSYYEGMATLPEDWRVMRRRAHEVRARTIADLDRYLKEFVEMVERNGLIVHWAEDAVQAVEFVLEIARQNHARLVAKSKSMVSEEIDLNHGLESAGVRVIETDLGEFIIQLRGERPAHIITPAVHLRKEDVGRLFQEKLDLPYTEDVSTLVAAARRTLRETFLNAEIGISGVNFGVAESGTLCLVTNEGNGRMVTTLPHVHIAIMGLERLVPTMEDLALMLALLPRAATGQKMSVYTTLIHSPRRDGDPDGPRQRHLILVDNGRRRMRASPLSEALLCIRCGACLNVCPVFREIGGHAYVGNKGESSPYSGPIGSIVSPGLFGQSAFGHLAQASSLCGACKEACPVDIDLPRLLLRVRAGGLEMDLGRGKEKIPGMVALSLRIYTWFAARSHRFELAQKMAAVFSRAWSPFSPWMRLPGFTGWGYSRDFPRPAIQPFRERWRSRRLGAATTGLSPNRSIGQGGQGSGSSEISNAGSDSLEADIRSAQSLVERFADELTALGGTVTFCQGNYSSFYEESLAGKVLARLQELGAKFIQTWGEEYLPAGLLVALKEAGIEISFTGNQEATAGLTGVLAAIADTGTLVLPSGAGRPQAASLLPEFHLAIVRTNDIYENLLQVLNLQEVREASSVSLISGPSRTADIEMTLSTGVHGPREVHVFCLME